MEAFFETFYNSFTSSADENSKFDEPRQPLYREIELIKVTAPRDDLNVFSEELSRIKHSIGVEISIVIPSQNKQDTELDQKRTKEEWDFLDAIFSDTIPFLHDFLTYGSPEAEFFQIKGPKGSLAVFNDVCATMIYARDLQCKLEITDRRKLYGPKYLRKTLKNDIFGCPNSEPDLLDAMFTDDFSKVSPALHGMLVA